MIVIVMNNKRMIHRPINNLVIDSGLQALLISNNIWKHKFVESQKGSLSRNLIICMAALDEIKNGRTFCLGSPKHTLFFNGRINY